MYSRKKPGERRPQICCGEHIGTKISSLKNKRKRHPKPRPPEEVEMEVAIFLEDVGA